MFSKHLEYLKFIFQGKSKYAIHSPFVHDFIENVLDNREVYYAFLGVEHVRSTLLEQKKSIKISDLGVGSKHNKSNNMDLKKLIKKVQSSSNKAQLLFKIVNYFSVQSTLEIGTSLGLTTAYLANANRNGEVTTIEGDPTLCEIAASNFNKLGLKNIKLINNSFDEALEDLFTSSYDFIFFDGNHSKEATLRYFKWAKMNMNRGSIYVFDDIYWSKGMYEAWGQICKDPDVSLSIDLFSVGMVFFHEKNQKEHFNLIHTSNFY